MHSKLRHENSSSILLDKLVIAESFMQRLLGLLFTKKLMIGEGMIFFNCNSLHMFFMPYTISAIFLSKEGVVLKIINQLKPWKVCFCSDAFIAIETTENFWLKTSVKIGDKLEVIS